MPWYPPDGLFDKDYTDDFVKLEQKPDKMKIPFQTSGSNKSQWKTFLLWLAIFAALFLATLLLESCSTSKRLQFKNHCNVKMVG